MATPRQIYAPVLNKYITNPDLKVLYYAHVTLVTSMALGIAKKLDLNKEQIEFIEIAGMLHDIGVVKVNDPEIFCYGKLPYLYHIPEGVKILESEGLHKYTSVILTHTGLGIEKNDIDFDRAGLEPRDYIPDTIEEEIISYSDLFYTKSPKRFMFKVSIEEVKRKQKKFGASPTQLARLDYWIKRFE